MGASKDENSVIVPEEDANFLNLSDDDDDDDVLVAAVKNDQVREFISRTSFWFYLQNC